MGTGARSTQGWGTQRNKRIRQPSLGKGKLRHGPHLHQAVAHQPQQQARPVVLPHQRRVLGAGHAGEVEHVDVGQGPVVEGELQLGQAVVGGEIGGFLGVAEEGVPVHVLVGQEALDVRFVLRGRGWGRGECGRAAGGGVWPPAQGDGQLLGSDPARLTCRMTPFLSRLCFLAVMTK